jgi:hypothetical protein
MNVHLLRMQRKTKEMVKSPCWSQHGSELRKTWVYSELMHCACASHRVAVEDKILSLFELLHCASGHCVAGNTYTNAHA